MTKAYEKIKSGLWDAIDGNWASATFFGIDLASGPDFSAMQCPKCFAPHRWSAIEATPKQCGFCGLQFKFVRSVKVE